MPKPLLYIAAFLALLGALYGIYRLGYASGVNAESVKQAKAIEAAVAQAREEFARDQAAVTDIESAGRESSAGIAAGADVLAEEIAHADLSPKPDRGVDHANPDLGTVRCVDPFGPEYYRLLRAIRDDREADAGTAGDVPGTDRGG